LGFSNYLFVIDLCYSSTVVVKHSIYDLNPFIFIDT
jgi:hypothetical protein